MKAPPRFERRLVLLCIGIALPGVLLSSALLVRDDALDPGLRILLGALMFLATAWMVASVFTRVVFPLRTLANILGGIREGDYSMRARGAMRDDALGEVFLETNALGQTLLEQRLGAMEATALLRTVMVELDVAVFAFDDRDRLCLANRAGESLLRRPSEQLLGRTAGELGLQEALTGDSQRVLDMALPAGASRYALRRSAFRQEGRPHRLVVLTDLGRVLRDEERAAWQRLLRVLGHEINNSLAPISSITGTLDSILRREPLPEDWRGDTLRGLGIILARAGALTRFIDAYSRLAKLPPPRKCPVPLTDLVRRVASLETRVPVVFGRLDETTFPADPDQLEQLLINLLRNAAEASLANPESTDRSVSVSVLVPADEWDGALLVRVEDTGLGIANPANLFVPFFTTKPGGSGIGLTLCRQIAEAHEGRLTLENRVDRPGAVATLALPRPA